MWICFNDGFVSAVSAGGDMLKVRARRKEHLISIFPNLKDEIVETKHTDYKYRVFIKRDEFADIVSDRIKKIYYDNFKSSVMDDELHDLYADFWSLHYQYQK